MKETNLNSVKCKQQSSSSYGRQTITICKGGNIRKMQDGAKQNLNTRMAAKYLFHSLSTKEENNISNTMLRICTLLWNVNSHLWVTKMRITKNGTSLWWTVQAAPSFTLQFQVLAMIMHSIYFIIWAYYIDTKNNLLDYIVVGKLLAMNISSL